MESIRRQYVCIPVTSDICPSLRSPETTSVKLLSLRPVVIFTADSRSPSMTQT